jgi:hypothetical protein
MGQFADELQAIMTTYVDPDTSGMRVMYMQMAGGNAWNCLGTNAYDADPDTLFKDTPYYSYESMFFTNTVAPTREDFYKTWCDLYYQYSGDASLREG